MKNEGGGECGWVEDEEKMKMIITRKKWETGTRAMQSGGVLQGQAKKCSVTISNTEILQNRVFMQNTQLCCWRSK